MKHFRLPRNAISTEVTMESPVPPKPSASKPRLRGSRMPPRRTLDLRIRSTCQRSQPPSPRAHFRRNRLIRNLRIWSPARMKPPHKDKDEEEMIVQKLSNDSLTSKGQTFTFDSVAFLDVKMSSDQQGTNGEC